MPGLPADDALSVSSSFEEIDAGETLPTMRGDLTIFDVLDPQEMSTSAQGVSFGRRLQDRDLMRARFNKPISRFRGQMFGSVGISRGSDRFATQIDIDGDGTFIAFYTMIHGRMGLFQNGHETTGAGSNGLVCRFTPGTRVLASDFSARDVLYIEASALEHALEGLLNGRLRERLAFRSGIDWTSGLAASLRGQIDFLSGEMGRRGGLADNPVALAFLTDLVTSLVLRGVSHNYSEQLGEHRLGAVPAYVRRADEFMRVHAAVPIRMEQVAAAAGCSIRTLNAVYRQFRDTTPLAALHAIRFEQVHAELKYRVGGTSIAEIARSYGFTNPGRFTAAYRRRFGESPAQTIASGRR